MQTLYGARLLHHARSARNAPALAMGERDISHAQLATLVHDCAAWLLREGCGPAETIGLSIGDELPHLVVSLALLTLGIPYVCLATREPLATRLALAEALAVRRVVALDEQYALPGCATLLFAADFDAISGESAPPQALSADPDAPAEYAASSGTTGTPKPFALSQRALAYRAEWLSRTEGLGSRSRALSLLPVENFLARNRLLRCVYMGYTAVLHGRAYLTASPQELCAWLNVTVVEMSVLHVTGLVAGEGNAQPFRPGTAIFTAGSRVPLSLRQKFRNRFAVPLFVHYGAREFGRIATTFPRRDEDDVETVGPPVPGVDLEIVDGDGRPLPRGEIGEVRVRGEGMASEYHRDPAATARHFRDGWFHPGDLGSLAPSGALCLHGRADDMMNLDGIKILPADIERVLEEHPGVRAAVAFAKSSPAHGDIPLAAIELHDSASVAIDELLAQARERLGVRAPRRIFVLAALPRNASGKVVRRELDELLAPEWRAAGGDFR
jgi:long-chain acyl-CoA synthetase